MALQCLNRKNSTRVPSSLCLLAVCFLVDTKESVFVVGVQRNNDPGPPFPLVPKSTYIDPLINFGGSLGIANMANPCGEVGFRMVRFLDVCGRSMRFVVLAILAPHGVFSYCTIRPCVVKALRTWQYNPPRVIFAITVHVLVLLKNGTLAALPLVV
ncbi:hypothetical protein Tco_0833725 [Tanacetum coccineum]